MLQVIKTNDPSSARLLKWALTVLVAGFLFLLSLVWLDQRISISQHAILIPVAGVVAACVLMSIACIKEAVAAPKRWEKTLYWLSVLMVNAAVIFCLLFLYVETVQMPQLRREFGGREACSDRLRVMATAVRLYQQDWGERFPPPENWNASVLHYIDKNEKSPLICPKETDRTMPSYAMNRLLKGMKDIDVEWTSDTVLFYESRPGRNLSGGPELFPQPLRHKNAVIVAFADGHTKSCWSNESYVWEPKAKKSYRKQQ